MRRCCEKTQLDAELSNRYILDEARFSGGSERTRNREVNQHEPSADFT